MSSAGPSSQGLPPDLTRILDAACRLAGIHPGDARLLRHFANAVFAVAGLVARIDYGPRAAIRSAAAVAITRWLAGRDFPVTEPVDLPSGAEQPVVVNDEGREFVVTFWRYYRQPEPLPPRDCAALGEMARRLHAIDAAPPVELPPYRPLTSLETVLHAIVRPDVLDADNRRWLLDRVDSLRSAEAALDYPLGAGIIHADLYTGNMIYDAASCDQPWRLGDWDGICIGPREIDLAPTVAALRFGLDPPSVAAFARAYGYDVRNWHGIHTLVQARELSTLPALIRLAPADAGASRELRHRIDSLRRGDTTVRWNPR